VVWVRERTIPTERPPLVGEVSANFCAWRVPRGQRDGSLRPYSHISRPEPLFCLPSSSSVEIIHFIQKYLIVFIVWPSTQRLSKQNNIIVLAFQSFGGPSITTVFFKCFLLLLDTHYMFRPLRAIFRWNIYTSYFLRSYFFLQQICCSCFGYQLYIYIYIFFCLFRRLFRHCLYSAFIYKTNCCIIMEYFKCVWRIFINCFRNSWKLLLIWLIFVAYI
jgi:hypothetical protein